VARPRFCSIPSQSPDYLEESLRIGKLTRAIFLLESEDALLVDDEDRPPGAVPRGIVDAVRLAYLSVDVGQQRVRQSLVLGSGLVG